MASRVLQGEASTSPATPLDILLATIPSLPRPLLSRLTARMIERLDEIDGDPDAEANGDEQDGTEAEDEGLTARTLRQARYFGPGCLMTDNDMEMGDL